MEKYLLDPSSSPFAHLPDYIIDLENMIGFIDDRRKIKNIYMLKVIRTLGNYRQRSRLQSRKGDGFDFDFGGNFRRVDISASYVNELSEFANMWAQIFNGGRENMPTPRQMLQGLCQFLELRVD